MSDEFDDALDAEVLRQGTATPATAKRQARPLAARLVSRLYAGASTPLRVGMLACLLRPLSPLGLVAVAVARIRSVSGSRMTRRKLD